MQKLEIRDDRDVIDAIREATTSGESLSIEGAGTKKRLGRHAPAPKALSTATLTGVTLYEPEELVLSARAGTPLTEIEALLEGQGQQLAFEPMDYAPLLGGAANGATIGGIFAANVSGPRRIKAGAARDHLLGFHCVTGRGDAVKSGGRVMKNVTGYDLSKLICGSFGTLALITEVTLKVLPRPETEATLLISGLDEAAALAQLRRVSGTPCEVSSYAMLPAGVGDMAKNTAALRLEGPGGSVATRREDLMARLKETGASFETLDETASKDFWRMLRDARPVAGGAGVVWRLSVAPADGFAVLGEIRKAAPVEAHFYDWAGGLIWLRVAPARDAHAHVVRGAVDRFGGHAALIRADDGTRSEIDVFHPQPRTLAALTRRVKESFDPAHVLERGRMRAEF